MIPKSEEVSDLVSEANSKGDVTSIKMYNFSTLYTNLPHTELKERIPKLVRESFEGFDKKTEIKKKEKKRKKKGGDKRKENKRKLKRERKKERRRK